MSIVLFILCVLPVTLILAKQKGRISFNAFWFSIFHFFMYALIGYAFPDSDADKTIQFIVMATGFLVFWGFLLGYTLASVNSRAGLKSRTPWDYQIISNNPRLQSTMVVFIGFTIVVGWLYFGGFPPVVSSIGSLLSGQLSSDAAIGVRDFRYTMTKAAYFGGEYRGQGIFRAITYTNCAIIVSYFAFYFAARGSRKSALYLGLSILFAFIFVGGVGDRGPFLQILLISACAYSMMRPFRVMQLVKVGILTFAMFILLSSLSTKGIYFFQEEGFSGIFSLIDSLVSRIFRGNSQYDFMIIELVETDSWSLRWGAVHLRNIITAIPGINYGVPVSYELFAYLNPSSDRTTFLSGTYLTHTYLDFGWFGSVIVYTIAGMLIAFISRYAEAKSCRSSITFLALPSLYFSLGKVIVYGIPGLIPSLVILFFVLGVLKVILSVRINFLKLRARH
ncbi:MAG: oligosaccharide repeat unit polymerase [Fimbriimonadaceae bacterium]|nr:oligosaccharide repeat unit polymerase [Alphaproteobacteria bacterium]